MNQFTLLSLLALVGAVSGFSSIQATTRVQMFGFLSGGRTSSNKLFLAKMEGYRGGDDFPPEEESEEFTGSVDWDAEWKKVVATDHGKLPSGEQRPPGRDFYESEAEIVTIQAAKNKASDEKVVDVTSVISSVDNNTMPDTMRSLAGDWKFWIALLAIVSIGLSVLTGPNMVPPDGGSDGSYYI